ncbi:hypothetical protein DFJ58DRAFT_772735 [Suillus subalutaceus]|uniref:uncharacterized protein n=1 Tax=Suillus subalutaceus TaxID=48586 RepID=UPI001B886EA1|nr:uncharacterized protein DFJ58DRAFT_772735 [Suillus subalutaceus]KAG1864115.1 hypothetical protein DFJ58DRAFT_772735 [Suillus subalutaceus]
MITWLYPSHWILLCLAPSTTKQWKKPILRMMLCLEHYIPFTLSMILLLPLAQHLHLSVSQARHHQCPAARCRIRRVLRRRCLW